MPPIPLTPAAVVSPCLGLATEVARGDVGNVVQMPVVGRERRKAECLALGTNGLDVFLLARYKVMIRHEVHELVEGLVSPGACARHADEQPSNFARGGLGRSCGHIGLLRTIVGLLLE